MPLYDLADLPRVVRLAGRDRVATEFRLADMAAVERAAADRLPDPTAGLPARDDPGFDAAWVRAYLVAERLDGCGWGGDECRAFLGTPEGAALFVYLALRRAEPGVTLAEAAATAAAMEADEWRALARVAYGSDPLADLDAMVGPRHGRGGPGVPWERVVCETMEAYSLGFDEVMSWTLSRLAAARSGGKRAPRGTDVSGMSAADIRRLQAERRARFAGHDGTNGGGGGGAGNGG